MSCVSPVKLCFGLIGTLLVEVKGLDMPGWGYCAGQGMRQGTAACAALQHCRGPASSDAEAGTWHTAEILTKLLQRPHR